MSCASDGLETGEVIRLWRGAVGDDCPIRPAKDGAASHHLQAESLLVHVDVVAPT